MNQKSYCKAFPSERYLVKNIIAEIIDFFSDALLNPSKEDLYDIKLIFSELLFNAVIHGNQEDNTKNVTLQIFLQEDGSMTATISDEGSGFDYQSLLAGIQKDGLSDGLFEESGRGICLVCALTDNVSFHNKGREIRIAKKVNICG